MHYPVLLNESVKLLNIKPNGIYIDGTFGRGGHSQAILARLAESGRLIAFDKDPEAIAFAKKNIEDPRLLLLHASFADFVHKMDNLAISEVDGILLDLGVSSPQLDTPERGFSFRFDAFLDMRMNTHAGITASEWLSKASESEMADVFWLYGEEKFSRKIARAIVSFRQKNLITTTKQLAELVTNAIPFREKGQHPATRVFQALRIAINNELTDLKQLLRDAPSFLAKEGRMVVISFHSLEDRIVKNSFNQLTTADTLPKWVMVNEVVSEFKVIAKKVKASAQEILENNRSRSAIMRCLERVNCENC